MGCELGLVDGRDEGWYDGLLVGFELGLKDG